MKYRSWPPRAGVTSYARIVENDGLAQRSAELCRQIGYRGIVDLDWRYDRRDQQYKLLDFNPRVGAQFRLFETTAGIDVVRAQHLDLTGRVVPNGAPATGRGFAVEILDVPARVAHTDRRRRRGSGAARSRGRSSRPGTPGTTRGRSCSPPCGRPRHLPHASACSRRTRAARFRRGRRPAPVPPRAIRRDAKSAPWTNLSNGPNVAAAVSPEKNSPGTDDSNDALSNGEPDTRRNDARRSSLTKPSASRPTR